VAFRELSRCIPRMSLPRYTFKMVDKTVFIL
jgi:hypothetical protein